MEKDWRYQHLQTQPYLLGVRWQMKTYRAPRADWDHDHCVGCWAKFMEHDSPAEPIEHEGYATTADYLKGAEFEWVCKKCFADFSEPMGWTLA